MLKAVGAALAVAASANPAAAGDAGWVAGTTPDRRPAGAPALTEHAKPPRWLSDATKGIAPPLPPSLRFLDDQGGWYTPFDRRGMPGPYDIRGLHRMRVTAEAPAGPRK
jgi:hypothetical protein